MPHNKKEIVVDEKRKSIPDERKWKKYKDLTIKGICIGGEKTDIITKDHL